MLQEPEKIPDHVSIVKVEEPVVDPHCADVYFEADFGDGREVYIRTRVPLKPLGALANVPMTSSAGARKAQAMNLLRETLLELDLKRPGTALKSPRTPLREL